MKIDPIPFYYETINRNAIVVRPKKPFFDWVNSIYKESEPIEERYEYNIYLVRERDSNEETLSWLKRNFHGIFKNELNDWIIDESKWPSKRTYKEFSEWFDIDICSMILDLEDLEITKD